MPHLAVLISAIPEQQAGCLSALRFCQAAVAQQQTLTSIFFYGAAVLIAQPSQLSSNPEYCVRTAWQQWALAAQLRLQLCSAAVARFGLTDPASPFEVNGLGQWLADLQHADRLLQFR
jgi:tRNA 2-thiouridine synthesizing protein D